MTFLTDRTQQVVYNCMTSVVQWVCYGVPQGLVLGPLLFILYTTDLSTVVASHGLTLHQSADDCQLYLSAPVADDQLAADRLTQCVADVAEWLSVGRLRLKLNTAKTLWLGSRQQINKVTVRDITVLSSSATVDTARDLGVIVHSQLTMSAHVSAVCRSAHGYLRQLRPVSHTSAIGRSSEDSGSCIHLFAS